MSLRGSNALKPRPSKDGTRFAKDATSIAILIPPTSNSEVFYSFKACMQKLPMRSQNISFTKSPGPMFYFDKEGDYYEILFCH